jgi:membrane-bound serine protease (ClpP class)
MKKLLFSLLLGIVLSAPAWAQKKNVVVLEIRDEIDTRMTRYVELGLTYAEKANADIVVIDMDTYGGVLTDAKDIVDKLAGFKKPIWVFINSDAASAGALISLACDSIYMVSGASIGAATVVDGSGQPLPDKYQSYMRSIMRATAEKHGRDPHIAEGMVDERIKIDSIKEEGRVLTFSSSEAVRYGYCEGIVTSVEDILKRNHVTDYNLSRYELSATDKIVNIFLNPFISGILILVILGGIYFEMQAPGLGFAGFAALVALILYLVPYYLTGLAENWEIIAFFIGLALIAAEIFVIPGFGVAGVAGLVLTLGSLVLIMLNNDAFDFGFISFTAILRALAVVMVGSIGSIILFFIGTERLSKSKSMNPIILSDTQPKAAGYTASFMRESMIGRMGTAQTVLRPSGKVLIDGQIYNAFTRGEYVEPGTPVEVISEETTSLKVKPVQS